MAKRNVQEVEIKVKDSASGEVKKIQSRFAAFGSFLKSRFVFTLGDVQRALGAVFDSIQRTVTLERQETALRGQLNRIGKDFDSFISTLQNVSNNTVSTADLIASSSRALLLGIPAEEIDNLLQIAASRAAATGQSVAQAFDDITTGIGRASPLILDNLGLVTNLTEVYGAAAEAAGKQVEALTQQDKQQALLNAVLKIGKADMEALGDATLDANAALDQVAAATANAKTVWDGFVTALGKVFIAAVAGAAARLVKLAQVISETVAQISTLSANMGIFEEASLRAADAATTAAQNLGASYEKLIETQDALNSSVVEGVKDWLGLGESIEDTNEKLRINTALSRENTAAQTQRSVAMKEQADKSDAYIQSMRTQAETTDDNTDSTETYREEAQRLLPVLDQLGSKFQDTAAKAAQLNAQTGGTLRVGSLTARSSRQQADVDAAIAAGRTPYSGGTRIRTADGTGSRLLQVG